MPRNSWFATIFALGVGLFGVAALSASTDWRALFAQYVPLTFFVALSFILKRAGFHVAPEITHSLVGVIDLAAVLSFGPILGAWVAALSGFFYLFLNALRREKYTFRNLLELPLFNAGLKIAMAYASAHAYTWFGGAFPPREFEPRLLGAAIATVLVWFIGDHLGWATLEFLRGGKTALSRFLRRIVFYSLLMELLPLPFSFLIAIVYVSLDPGVFVLLAAGLVGTAIILQRFADTSVRLERRSADLAALNAFGQALAHAAFDPDHALDLLHAHAQRIVAADFTRIELFNREHPPEAGAFVALEATPTEIRHPNETRSSAPLLAYFSAHREPIRALDLARAFVYPFEATPTAGALFHQLQTEQRAWRSALIVPLFAGEDLIGALSLYAAKPRTFFVIHARNLAAMCAEAAVAIQNARLYAVERKRAAQLAMVSEVSRQVASFLDLDDLLQNVVQRIRERFGYTNVHIFTVEKEAGYVTFRASTHARGGEWRERGVKLRVGLEGIVGWVAATREPLIVDDVRRDARFLLDPDKALADTRSEIAVPLISGDQLRGVLDVQSDACCAFGDEDLFVLKTLAAQVAVALEDARLYNSQREEAYYLNVLLQVAENLAATTDLAEALETVVRITPLLVGVARCAVFLHHAGENVFLPAKAYGLSRELHEKFEGLRFRSNDPFIFGELTRRQAPLMIEDATANALIEADLARAFGLRSLLIAPLITRAQVVGALLVDQGARPTHFTQHEIDVVMAIANQAAVAIEGARLREQAADKRRLDYELQLARQIQASFLPEACPIIPGYEICSLWQTAREVSGDFYDFVALSHQRVAMTIADVSDKGMAAAMFMALSRTILRTMTIGKPTARDAVERANDVILADARSEMFVTVFHGILDPQQHHFTYVNAGHNPPFLYRAAERELTTVKGHGIALGVLPNITLEEHELDLHPGDVLLMYTDGVTDAINAQEEEFGAERLADLVAANATRSASALIDAIQRALTEFAGEGAHFDDVTMIALKRV